MMVVGFIEEFGVLFILIVALAFLTKVAKQPIIIGYVLAGLLFPLVQGYTVSGNEIVMMSELGITFLLFLMGLEFDLSSLKYLGKDLLLATLLQSVVFFIVPFFLAGLFGFSTIERVYLSILFMFSSTLLVAKWLDDKKESTTLHGKIILGTLLLQDVLAILALTILGVLQEHSVLAIVTAPVKGLLLIGVAFLLAKYALNRSLHFASKYPELLFVVGLGVCFFFVLIAPFFGYSTTIGAFIGGITLANTIYKNEVATRLRPLIAFFNILFFVGLGFQMDLHLGMNYLLFILLLTALSLLFKPLVIHLTLRLRGYDLKTSFISALHLAQLSEFGIIIAAAGVFSGMIQPAISSLAIILVLLTMIISSYLIKYDHQLFKKCEPFLRRIDWKAFTRKDEMKIESVDINSNILIFGYYNLGNGLLQRLKELGKSIVIIDNDPENIEMIKKEGVPYIYNTINNPEFLMRLNLQNVELVVSSLLDREENKTIIQHLKRCNPHSIAIVTAKNVRDSLELYNHQADYVIYPTYVNEQHVSILLEEYTTDINKVIAKKIEDIARLKEREAERKEAARELSKLWDIDKFFKFITRRELLKRQERIKNALQPQELVQEVAVMEQKEKT